MVRRYVKFSMPIRAMELLNKKQIKLQDTIKQQTGRIRHVPKTKIITKILEKPIWLDHNEVINLSKRRVKI